MDDQGGKQQCGARAALDLRVGSIASESSFLVTLTRSTIRAREAAVQDSDTSVYEMHEKDSEDSVYKMHEGWEMEDGRWEMGGRGWPYRRFLDKFPHRKLDLESLSKPDFLDDF